MLRFEDEMATFNDPQISPCLRCFDWSNGGPLEWPFVGHDWQAERSTQIWLTIFGSPRLLTAVLIFMRC
jgi:hypothetical protein